MAGGITVAVAGLGGIGLRVARALDARPEGLRLVAVAGSSRASTLERVAQFRSPPEVMGLDELAGSADIVVECLPPALFRQIAQPALSRAGVTFLPASVGALLGAPDLLERAKAHGARIVIPSGALAGLDALVAAREAGLEAVRLVTRKPPRAFGPVLCAELPQDRPQQIFTGNALEATRAFPRNVNVAATLALLGLGAERTEVEIWSDPALSENCHEVTIHSAAGTIRTESVNRSDPDNPGSSTLAAWSVLATLRTFSAPVMTGSFPL